MKVPPQQQSQLSVPPARLDRSTGPLYIALADCIQGKILSGEYKLGSALPSVSELAELYSVASMTARQALTLLEKKGFVQRKHGKGTFVLEGAGRLLIGIMVGPSLTDEATYCNRAVVRALREVIESRNWHSRVYDDLTCGGFPRPLTASAVRQLQLDLNAQVFHGFIEFAPGVLGIRQMHEGFPLPKVRSEPAGNEPNDVEFDDYHFGYSAVEFLARRGFEEIVYLRPLFQTGHEMIESYVRDLDGMSDACKVMGLPPPVVHHLNLDAAPGMAPEADELLYQESLALLRNRRKKRRLGLVHNDDIGMRTVALAFMRENIEVPKECEIVCLCHEGVEHYYGIPVHRYERPVRAFAEQMVSVLEARIYQQSIHIPLPAAMRGEITEAKIKRATRQHASVTT